MEVCGLMAEGYAKRLCRVDTGLLRNSITHALSGGSTSITYYTDDKGEQSGSYEGTMPVNREYEFTMYLGTNVEYGPYVEMGTTHTNPHPFIKPAIANHPKEYENVLQSYLGN